MNKKQLAYTIIATACAAILLGAVTYYIEEALTPPPVVIKIPDSDIYYGNDSEGNPFIRIEIPDIGEV